MSTIFFDLDNTIINTKEVAPKAYEKALSEVAKKYKTNLSGLFKEWKSIVNELKAEMNPKKRLFSYSLKKLLNQREYKFNKKFIDYIVDIQENDLIERLKFTPGTKRFLEGRHHNYYQVIFTENPKKLVEKKLKKFNILKEFRRIITAEEVGSMKPHPAYYTIIYKEFDMYPDQGYYIGDNWEKDCELPSEAGGVGILFRGKDDEALFTINNMLELYDIFKMF